MSEPPPTPRAWLITGCSSGLGLALATEALVAGHMVVATARNPSALDDLAARFPETCRVLESERRGGVSMETEKAGRAVSGGKTQVSATPS